MESRAPVGGGGIRILIPQIIENLSILSGQYNCIYSGSVLYRPDINKTKYFRLRLYDKVC